MASSSSSDESCKAPDNFRISSASTNGEEDEGNDVAGYTTKRRLAAREPLKGIPKDAGAPGAVGMRCPLCHSCSASRYHCRNCVRNGNITHSQAERPERFGSWLVTLSKTRVIWWIDLCFLVWRRSSSATSIFRRGLRPSAAAMND